MRALEMVLGAPPAEQAENIDCGATLAKWPNGLTTWFSGGRFVGWSVGSQDSGPASAGGLRVGVSRSDLQTGGSTVEIRRTTLGTEFQSGGIGGLLESPGAEARVSNLWAGATCIAR